MKKGLNYFDVFAPIARLEIVILIISLTILKCQKMWQLDVKYAFLNGWLDEEIYIGQPCGFVQKGGGGKHKMLKLRKALLSL